MRIRLVLLIIPLVICFHTICFSQTVERVEFKEDDHTSISYLAIMPWSKKVKGTIVLFSSFTNLNWLSAQTKLHNIAYTNDLLFVYATLNDKFYADSGTLNTVNVILNHVVTKFSTDTSKFVLGGMGIASNIVLRYTELSNQHPETHFIQPKAIFFSDCYADLFNLVKRLNAQLQKNFDKDDVAFAKYIQGVMAKNIGEINTNRTNYKLLSPFNYEEKEPGPEEYLRNTPIRLYYDIDPEWQLTKRNSFFDTNIPEGSELIKRLLLLGNKDAEFITSKQHGVSSDGVKDPTSLSIINEVDCIHWIKQKLDIFDYNTWIPKYAMMIPKGWRPERHPLPAPWAQDMTYKGVLDMRFANGWGDSTSKDYWSYTHLWWLEGNPEINISSLNENLIKYFDGLNRNHIRNFNIPKEKFIPTSLSLKKIETGINDIATYSGVINTFDSHVTQRALKLNCRIHIRRCSEQQHTAIFIEFSPQSYNDKIWKSFSKIWDTFSCEN